MFRNLEKNMFLKSVWKKSSNWLYLLVCCWFRQDDDVDICRSILFRRLKCNENISAAILRPRPEYRRVNVEFDFFLKVQNKFERFVRVSGFDIPSIRDRRNVDNDRTSSGKSRCIWAANLDLRNVASWFVRNNRKAEFVRNRQIQNSIFSLSAIGEVEEKVRHRHTLSNIRSKWLSTCSSHIRVRSICLRAFECRSCCNPPNKTFLRRTCSKNNFQTNRTWWRKIEGFDFRRFFDISCQRRLESRPRSNYIRLHWWFQSFSI